MASKSKKYLDYIGAGVIAILSATVFILITIILFSTRCLEKREGLETQCPSFPIYIVSLPRRANDRLIPLMKRIEPSQCYGVTVSGVDGSKEVVVDKPTLSQGQIGCWLSHVEIWTKISKLDVKFALILEDDAMIELPRQLADIFEIVDELDSLGSKWAMCYLAGRYADPSSIRRVSQNLVMSSTSRMWHSHAYLLTPEAARSLLDMSKSWNQSRLTSSYENVEAVDDWMTSPSRGLGVYKVEPDMVPYGPDGISDTK